jgi:hypothetical protein
MLISDKVDFKPKLVRKEKGHFILIKEGIHQEEIAIVNLYAPNVGAPNFIKHLCWRIQHSTVTNR